MGCNHFRNGAGWGGSTSRQQESWFSLAAGERLSRRNRPGLGMAPLLRNCCLQFVTAFWDFEVGRDRVAPFTSFFGGWGWGGGWGRGGGGGRTFADLSDEED